MTAAVVAVKDAVVAPDATVTEAGTVTAEVLLLERVTTEPAEGAALVSMTLQMVVAEAARLVLPHCRDVIEVGALMAKAVEALDAPMEAVTVTF